jgi:hypothetical protein
MRDVVVCSSYLFYSQACICAQVYHSGTTTCQQTIWDCCASAGESIIAAAQKAFQQAAAEGSRGSSSSSSSQWLPVLPAARCALLSVLVHTQGVTAAGKLLLTELEEQLGVQQQGQGRATAPVGRKGKAASGAARPQAAAAAAPAAAPAARLLSLPVVNSFLATAVKVAVGYQREGLDEEGEAAARAAVEVFTEIFKLQVAAVTLAATGAAAAVPAGGTNSLDPNADSWASVLQLHGCLGPLPQASNIVLAACRQQLPGVSSATGLQAVLAAAAGAFNAAGRHTAAVQLLDGLVAAGVTAVSHPMLAQQLLNAAEKSSEAEQVRRVPAMVNMALLTHTKDNTNLEGRNPIYSLNGPVVEALLSRCPIPACQSVSICPHCPTDFTV